MISKERPRAVPDGDGRHRSGRQSRRRQARRPGARRPDARQIFLGEITNWNDPAIKKLNPNVTLPNQAIAVVHRSDGSGTTYNFTYYLADVSPDWKANVGVNTAVEWPVGIGAKGNEGVANNVAKTGAIGYVEYAYAKQNKLTYTDMINKDGKKVEPTAESFQAAAANADWKSQPGYGVILANQPVQSPGR